MNKIFKTLLIIVFLTVIFGYAEEQENWKYDNDKSGEEVKHSKDSAYKEVFKERFYGVSTSIIPDFSNPFGYMLGFGFRADIPNSKEGPIMWGIELNIMIESKKDEYQDVIKFEHPIHTLFLAQYIFGASEKIEGISMSGARVVGVSSYYLETGPIIDISSKDFGGVLGTGFRFSSLENVFKRRLEMVYGIRLIYLNSLKLGVVCNMLL